MRPTGIESVFSSWKDDILPINYECFRQECLKDISIHSYRILFYSHLNAQSIY